MSKKSDKAERFQPILNRAEEEAEQAIREATLGRPRDGLQRREDRRVEHALRIKDMTYFLDH